MPKVYFVVENLIVDAGRGQTVREVALKHGVHLNREVVPHLNCAGHGICGTCRIWVNETASEALSPRTLREKAYGMRGSQRLACQARIEGDVEIYSAPGGDDRLDTERVVFPPVQEFPEPSSEKPQANVSDSTDR